MFDERINRAKRAELRALVDEHGTEGEKFSLDLNGFVRIGGTLLDLHRAAAGDETVRTGPPDPELLAQIVARIELRRRLGIERVDCASGVTSCTCLRDTLDELADDERVTKRKLLASGRRLHKARHPVGVLPKFRHLLPKPRPKPAVAPERPTTPPAPIPAAVVNETQTKPFRRRKRWWDDDRGGGGIRGMRF